MTKCRFGDQTNLRHLLNNTDHEDKNMTTDSDAEAGGFQKWWSKQNLLKKRIQNTCQKFGPSLRKNISRHKLMYDRQHKLLFCRNAKVVTIQNSEEGTS